MATRDGFARFLARRQPEQPPLPEGPVILSDGSLYDPTTGHVSPPPRRVTPVPTTQWGGAAALGGLFGGGAPLDRGAFARMLASRQSGVTNPAPLRARPYEGPPSMAPGPYVPPPMTPGPYVSPPMTPAEEQAYICFEDGVCCWPDGTCTDVPW